MNKADLVIIGAGIAGISAAVYAKRSGIEPVIFEGGSIGGQLLFMESVDNYAGLKPGTKGSEMTAALIETLGKLKIEPINERISQLSADESGILLTAESAAYQTKAVILATGASFKRLGIPGEDEFVGKGVSYCAVCDGFFFRGLDVAVVGGGNTAIEEALYLANFCRTVYLIHRKNTLRAMEYLKQELKKHTNIKTILESQVTVIKGSQTLEKLVLEGPKGLSELPVSGLFVAIGVRPNTEAFKGFIDTDDNGFILTGNDLRASRPDVWACGDCRVRPLRQLITAASEGALAALEVYRFLKGGYISV
jgi:thioredoxin reductase (NADPH)